MAALASQGTILAVSTDSGSTWVDLCQLSSINGPDGSSSEIEVTTLCSSAKEYISGLADYGNVAISGMYDPANAGLVSLKTLYDSGDEAQFRITLTDTASTEITFDGYVNAYSWAFEADDASRVSSNIRVTGPVTVT